MDSRELPVFGPRTSSPVAVLLDPERDIPPTEEYIRVEDYLNDKIQTYSDFEGLDSLIASVKTQQKQLEEQLQDARSQLSQAKEASNNHTSAMLEKARQFESEQASIHTRLMLVTDSNTPDEALSRLKGPMEKLRRLELAHSYVDLLNDVERHKVNARSHLPENPKLALQPYTELKELALNLQELSEPAEDAAVHLVAYVQKTTVDLWKEMEKIMCDDFEAILRKINWPNLSYEPTREWTDCFERLLDLQTPELMAANEPLILLPMASLAKSFILQFRYHFYSDRPTNHSHRLGDFFFEWFLGTIDKWEDFLRVNIGPVLAAHFKGNRLAEEALYVDPVAAFISALLPILQDKVKSVAAEISHEPQYLSRFIIQMMTFDDAVRSRFGYDGGNAHHGWKGVTWPILDTWFDDWYKAEKEFALGRYREIVTSEASGVIDYDSTGQGKSKPTFGATQVTDLILTVTLQYNKLRKFSQKIQFLIGIQAEILDMYLGRLNDALEYYQTATSAVGRTLHGVTKEQQAELQGLQGLDRLCRVFGSSEHLISMLKAWANEEFFIDLYEQLHGRAIDGIDAGAKMAGDMSFTEVKECTSYNIGSETEGSVFDVTIESAERLRKRAENLIVAAIKYSLPTAFRPYFTKPQWTTIGEAPTQSSLVITPELDAPLNLLREHMSFLRKALADAPFRRIWRNLFDYLEDTLYNEVLMRQDFTSLGASRLVQDVIAIHSVIDACMGHPKIPLGMPKLREAAALLSLPVEAEEGDMSLQDAAAEIFKGNSEAAGILEKLGLGYLSNSEARAILKRRLEANSD